ncbi:uncharacterized protein EDB91DRAFT_1253011 [Suillus paluster]|uniref:uncharacterized protein n=1 Tax=Suillus paluster TaxID=48578 RepID=UPI001B85C91F|nr:uncharacterized protein EDB91DRAFT_1253011 [Suillus paluster]KAG1729497.1 hypothetical protein EDB91DRAFT_1253011 [Suillus paluster]
MHIVLSLKDMGKVFAVRSRRSTKNKHSTAIEHDGDSSIPADIHGSFPSPTLHSNISYSQGLGVSLAREASDLAQLALPLVQTAVGVIPLVGPPMKVAIGGLLEILQAVDRRGQNRADLDGLELRLHRLSSHLCNAPPVQDPLEQSRRDSLVSMLQETSAQLTKLHRRVLAYTSVTQAIAGCSSQIDRYLAEYSLSSQMQSQHDMREVLASQQRHHEENQRHHEENQKLLMEIQRLTIRVGPTATQLTGTVTLIDATGHEHPISVNFCTSFQQLNEMLQVLFKRDSIEARVQRQYIENGQYDLCIDEGTRVTQLTNHRWSSIEEGTKIVMRVIIEHKKTSSEVYYTCHFCGARNHLPSGSVNYSLGRQVGCSIDWLISHRYLSSEESTGSSNIDSNSTTEAEMHLIRNFHVQQTEVRGLVLWATYPMLNSAKAKILSKKFVRDLVL